jgi:hypothetical protein
MERDLRSLYPNIVDGPPAKSAAVATPPPPPVDRWQRVRAYFATGSDAGKLRVASPDVCHWPPCQTNTAGSRDFSQLAANDRLTALVRSSEGQNFVRRAFEQQKHSAPFLFF